MKKTKWNWLWLLLIVSILIHIFVVPYVVGQVLDQGKNKVQIYEVQ